MTWFVLDTDHLTLLQREHPGLVQRIAATPPDDLATTIITVEEQVRGWLDAIRRHAGSERQVWAYRGLQAALRSSGEITVLDFDESAYRMYATLRQRRLRIGAQDMRIAAIVLATGGTLLTRNRRDFAQVSGLKFEDWTGG